MKKEIKIAVVVTEQYITGHAYELGDLIEVIKKEEGLYLCENYDIQQYLFKNDFEFIGTL